MHILFWCHAFWPAIGGVQVFAAKLLSALRARGYEIVVVTAQENRAQPTEDRYKGIPVYRFPFKSVTSYTEIDELVKIQRQIAGLKRTFKPDLVHVNSVVHGNFFHLITANAHPAPLLLTLHLGISPGDTTGSDTFLGQNLRAADWVTAVSSLALSQVRRRVPELISRSSVIHNALEPPPLPPAPLPTDTPRLLCLGRLTRQKGFDLAVTAVASLTDYFPHLRLVIAGDGPARPELERQVAELRLQGVVEFLGWVEPAKVPALLNTATLVVMPSRFEGLPLVALEAALMARPVVGTRVDGLLDVVVHRQTGLLVEPEDPKALAAAIAAMFAHPAAAVRMGQAARSRARDVFGWERHVNAYDTLYRQLIAGWQGRTSSHPNNRVG